MPEVKVGLACSSTQLPQTKRVPTSSRGFPGWLQCVSTCCAASVPAQRLDPRSPRVAPAVPCSCVYCNSFANLVSAAAAPLAYLVCARAWLLDVSDSRLRPCPCSAVCMSLGAHRRSWRARPTARSLSHSISRSVSLSPFPSPPPTHSPRRSHSRSIWVGAHGRTWCCLVPWVCARGRRRMIFKRCTQRSTATRTSSLPSSGIYCQRRATRISLRRVACLLCPHMNMHTFHSGSCERVRVRTVRRGSCKQRCLRDESVGQLGSGRKSGAA